MIVPSQRAIQSKKEVMFECGCMFPPDQPDRLPSEAHYLFCQGSRKG